MNDFHIYRAPGADDETSYVAVMSLLREGCVSGIAAVTEEVSSLGGAAVFGRPTQLMSGRWIVSGTALIFGLDKPFHTYPINASARLGDNI